LGVVDSDFVQDEGCANEMLNSRVAHFLGDALALLFPYVKDRALQTV
jgi:hypothetical protein